MDQIKFGSQNLEIVSNIKEIFVSSKLDEKQQLLNEDRQSTSLTSVTIKAWPLDSV